MLVEAVSAWQVNNTASYHTRQVYNSQYFLFTVILVSHNSYPPSYHYPFKKTGPNNYYTPASYPYYDGQRAVPQYSSYPYSISSLNQERGFEQHPCQSCANNLSCTLLLNCCRRKVNRNSHFSIKFKCFHLVAVEVSVPAYQSQENNRRPRKDRLNFTIDS